MASQHIVKAETVPIRNAWPRLIEPWMNGHRHHIFMVSLDDFVDNDFVKAANVQHIPFDIWQV